MMRENGNDNNDVSSSKKSFPIYKSFVHNSKKFKKSLKSYELTQNEAPIEMQTVRFGPKNKPKNDDIERATRKRDEFQQFYNQIKNKNKNKLKLLIGDRQSSQSNDSGHQNDPFIYPIIEGDSLSPVKRDVKVNSVVRKKCERKELNGYVCKECEAYYDGMDLTEEEIGKRLKKCSRHKAQHSPQKSPEHFWETSFPSTPECIARGYLYDDNTPSQTRMGKRKLTHDDHFDINKDKFNDSLE